MRVFAVGLNHAAAPAWIFPTESPDHARVIVAAALERWGYTIERPDLELEVQEVTRLDVEMQMRKYGDGAFDKDRLIYPPTGGGV